MTVLTELQKIPFLMSRYWFSDSQIWTASGRHQLLDLPSLHLFKKKKSVAYISAQETNAKKMRKEDCEFEGNLSYVLAVGRVLA